jgi:hypothetical protein
VPCWKTIPNPFPKEKIMTAYKTIALNLLERRPEIHEELRKERKLLATMERYAGELKALHEGWKEQLSQARPGSDEGQIATEALEMAIEELEASLPSALVLDEGVPLSLDEAMAFLRRHTPPA